MEEKQEAVTDFEMAEAMIAFGGGFVSHLGSLWMRADETNRAKILATWPEYCETYRGLATLKHERART